MALRTGTMCLPRLVSLVLQTEQKVLFSDVLIELTLGHRALQARVEGIAGEEG